MPDRRLYTDIPAADAGIGGGEQRGPPTLTPTCFIWKKDARRRAVALGRPILTATFRVDAPFRVHAVHLRKGPLFLVEGVPDKLFTPIRQTGFPCALGYRPASISQAPCRSWFVKTRRDIRNRGLPCGVTLLVHRCRTRRFARRRRQPADTCRCCCCSPIPR